MSFAQVFKRRRIQLSFKPEPANPNKTSILPLKQGVRGLIPEEEYSVLVVNSSQEMAKEITMELTLAIPGCSIMYAPTIDLAKLILARRKINLVVSAAVLPDGGVVNLRKALAQMKAPPDVVVVGDLSKHVHKELAESGYQFTSARRISQATTPRINRKTEQKAVLSDKIRDLGADLRTDLNNPLQEIVAMVFVAQAGQTHTPAATLQALEAIDKAAKNMATVVRGLEDKILKVVAVNER